jgi:hypothetical protein
MTSRNRRKPPKGPLVIHSRKRGNKLVTITQENDFYSVTVTVAGTTIWHVVFTHLAKALAHAKRALEDE